MAYYSGHTPRLAVSNLPSNFSKPKLSMKLEEIVGKGRVLKVDSITKTSAKVVVLDEEAQRKLLRAEVTLLFGGRNYQLVVEKVGGGDSSDDDEDIHEYPSDDEIFTFESEDKETKAILRYLSKTDKHRNALAAELRKCGSKLINLSLDEIEAELPKGKSRSGKTPENICENCIKNFISLFSSWNEKLDGCTNANVTYIISLLAKNKQKCYGTWFNDSKTILVTGPEEVVAEIRELVEKHLDKTDESETLSPSGTSQSFEYTDVQAAIMRFVSKQDYFNSQLAMAMGNLAHVEIKGKETLAVHVSPTQNTINWPHVQFERRCKDVLKAFFHQFDLWRGKFDLNVFKAQQARTPDLFLTKSYPDHYIQWFHKTGTVNVTGTCAQVQRCRQIIEEMLGGSTISPKKQSQLSPPVSPIRPVMPMVLTAASPHFLIQPLPVRSPMFQVSASPPSAQNQHQPRSRRRTSSGDFSDEPGSTRSETVLFDTEDILPAVLKFVSNDPASKKALEKCCKRLAKITIKNDLGQLKVEVAFKQKNYSPQDKAKVFTSVQKYFEKFDSQTKKYDRKKLKELVDKHANLFELKPGGVFIKPFTGTGTVKITGLTENVEEKGKEIDHEIYAEVEVETLPADVFIAQRECELWKKVEEKCEHSGGKISITSVGPGKIQYKGSRSDIWKAKGFLGNYSEELFQKRISGLSLDQVAYLQICGKSQQEYNKTGENKLDAIYRAFKNTSIQGSLAFQDSGIDLICMNSTQWQIGNNLLAQIIVHFEVDLGGNKPDASFPKLCKSIKSKMESSPAYIKEQMASKRILVFCLKNQEGMINRKITEIMNDTCDVKEIKKFYPMSEERARHILNPHSQCKIYKAKSVTKAEQSGQCGLLVTCENEDIDAVDMSFEDLKLEIVTKKEKIAGFSFYEYLMKDEKYFRVQRDTNCSIFIEQDGQVARHKASSVSVKCGDILNEKCDAIVNSTGRSISFSGQLSKSLAKKYGRDRLAATMKHAKWIVQDQICLAPTSGLFPWSYIFYVATPGEHQLKKFILDLLRKADRLGIKSIALPTIGTGNLGLDPVSVAKCMRDAFVEFCSGQVVNLMDIRLVVYEQSMYLAFKDIAPEAAEQRSIGIVATIYGNTDESLQKAVAKLKEIRDSAIKSSVIEDASLIKFPALVKSRAQEICNKHEVALEWRDNGVQENGHLQGVLDNVKRAEDEIYKLLQADFPHNWSPMTDDQLFVKEKLDKKSEEYLAIRAKFKQSSPAYTKISKIERIQNPFLYMQFKNLKDIKQTEKATRSVTKQLFHGTAPDKVDKICAAGFDRNYAGENGTAYGRGTYFHVNSSYSASYSGYGSTRCIFLAEVITGDYTQGNAAYKAPPEKENAVLYDSVVDNVSDPKIYVVFRDQSVYPSYLITFQ